MASADRREARRRKLLQNSELRLGRILGSRSSHPTAPHEPEKTLVKSIDLEKRGDEGQSNEVPVERGFLSDKSELPSEYQSVKSGFTTGSEESTEPITEAMKEKRNSLESKLDYLTEDSTTRGTNLLSSPGEDQTGDQGAASSISKRLRVLLNVTLAFLLVVKWAYINLEALHSAAASSQQSPASSQKYLIYSESMMWPFLALQLLFACLTSMQQSLAIHTRRQGNNRRVKKVFFPRRVTENEDSQTPKTPRLPSKTCYSLLFIGSTTFLNTD
ncbi:uncharacterized protein [Montipora foliosa]|uniref:uncharacterized protein isoform X2 n=1 Tax=Montipora foliosa TaxID=591990 RepID=UPI0035F12DFF